MCQQATTLAVHGNSRQIWRCEHGTIHLNWEQATLRLHPNDFRRAVRLLEEGVTELGFNKVSEGNCMVVPQENGFYQFWYGNVMLILDSLAFFQLVDLVRAAECQLDKLRCKDNPPQQLRKHYGDGLDTILGSGFSIN